MSSAPPGFAPSDLGAAFHADADATRGAHARELLGARWVAYALTLGIGATILLGAAQHSMGTMVIGPMVVLALVALAVFRAASKRSEEDFYAAMARGLGLSLSPHAALLPLTPLLGAGDRRNFAHLMEGPVARLNPASPACVLGHYAYEVRHERGDEPDVYESHAFTICVVELEQGLQRFRGIFLRRRRGLVGGLGHDWLAGIDRRDVQLESIDFNELYELDVDVEQDDIALRQLFAPSFVAWLAAHPLRPGFEYRAGTLVAFVPGHVEDAGRLIWLRDATNEIASRIARDVRDAAAARPVPAAG